MSSPDDRRYRETHEWHKLEDGVVTVGISRFAVDELTDITYVEITKTAGDVQDGDVFGEIESVKTTSDLYVGVDGEVIAINQEVIDNPALINQDPYNQGWLIKIKTSDPQQIDNLMSASEYDEKYPA